MNPRERSIYIDEVRLMTLRELREEISMLNRKWAILNLEQDLNEYIKYKLCICSIELNNFFAYYQVDESKTQRELKEELKEKTICVECGHDKDECSGEECLE